MRTTTLLLAMMFILFAALVWADNERAQGGAVPSIPHAPTRQILGEAVLAGLADLEELDGMFAQFDLDPALWAERARSMRDRWENNRARAVDLLYNSVDDAEAIVSDKLNPWAEEYQAFISDIIIEPGYRAMLWKHVIELRMDWYGRMPGAFGAVMEDVRRHADVITDKYEELEAYANSGVDPSSDPSAHAQRRAEARALVVYARNVGSVMADKQDLLLDEFLKGDPDNWHDEMAEIVQSDWDINGAAGYPDYPHVLPRWKDLVSGWIDVCVESFDEYAIQYENAVEACLPITDGTLFDDYEIFRGLEFDNLAKNVLELQRRIDGM